METARHNKQSANLTPAWSLLSIIILLASSISLAIASEPPTKEIRMGFSAKQDDSYSQFQPLLSDPTGIFSLGFLKINSTLLDLAVLHLPSSLPLWRAMPANPAPWTGSISLSFNGSLLLSDPKSGTILWSTDSSEGDRVLLLNSSNLQIQKTGNPNSVVWESFDFPTDTIVQNQNFTSSAKLFSPNQQFFMSLGTNFFSFYMEFGKGRSSPMYFKHTALEAKAEITQGGGPIYARVEPEGFLGLYQKEGPPADVVAFDSFNLGFHVFRRMTLENDGNLRSYYWNNSFWILDYTTIQEPCDLPTTCGPYGICSTGGECNCLLNGTDGCKETSSGDLCGSDGNNGDGYSVVRRQGIDLANKELLGFTKMGSLEECEGICEKKCSCWGAIYSNTTGYCYTMDYPIETVVEGDDSKHGYFKVSGQGGGGDERKEKEMDKVRMALLVVGSGVLAVAGGFGAYRIWERRRKEKGGGGENGLAPGPYKDLASSSFRSIELSSDSFRKQGP